LKKLIFNTISISVSAQLATLPLVLYYFHQFSFISIIANFFIVPFSEAIIVFSFLMTIFIALNLDFNLMNVAYDFVIQILLTIIHWFADFSHLFHRKYSHESNRSFCFISDHLFSEIFILKPKLKNFTIVMTAVFAFYILRIGFNSYENQRETVS
jgi:competence protein ComEC